MKKVAIHTLGCKTNQYDSDAMLAQLTQAGYTLVPDMEEADVIIINTCTVTAEADRKSRQILRQATQANPNAIVVAAGCYAQRDPQQLAALLGVDVVLGNQERSRIVEWIERAKGEGNPINGVGDLTCADFEPLSIERSSEHTRANIKIQEGCNRFCTYCIIPHVRGPIRSRPLADTVAEVTRLAALGTKEIVLTGIHIASYGLDFAGSPSLIDLLEALDQVEGVERIRLGSLEPALLREEFCARAAKLGRLCHHFHISLQSGCSATLKRMGRRYTAEEFTLYVKTFKAAMPDAALTTDVIVGFPQESEEDFETSLSFVEATGFSRIHVFPYSPREGTPAATMSGQIERAVKRERTARMLKLGEKLLLSSNQRAVGTKQRVLLEETDERHPGMVAGYTPHYTRVLLPEGQGVRGEIVEVMLDQVKDEAVIGHRVYKEDNHD